jgi:hypothetical protein
MGGTTEHVSQVSAAGMRQPGLNGWIHDVPDNVLHGDAFPPHPVIVFNNVLCFDAFQPHPILTCVALKLTNNDEPEGWRRSAR